MRFVIFTHSLVSDWNHGNAHFLRGFATTLVERGHDVRIFEPRDGVIFTYGGGPVVEAYRALGARAGRGL